MEKLQIGSVAAMEFEDTQEYFANFMPVYNNVAVSALWREILSFSKNNPDAIAMADFVGANPKVSVVLVDSVAVAVTLVEHGEIDPTQFETEKYLLEFRKDAEEEAFVEKVIKYFLGMPLKEVVLLAASLEEKFTKQDAAERSRELELKKQHLRVLFGAAIHAVLGNYPSFNGDISVDEVVSQDERLSNVVKYSYVQSARAATLLAENPEQKKKIGTPLGDEYACELEDDAYFDVTYEQFSTMTRAELKEYYEKVAENA